MRITYGKYNPSGNTTIIVDNRDGKIAREEYASLAAELMKPENLSAEQVGYVEEATIPGALLRLHMMGGEFCGNASRCMAKYVCEQDIPGILWNEDRTKCQVPIEMSGHTGVLWEQVEDYAEEACKVRGAMPLPMNIERTMLEDGSIGAMKIYFDGILHVTLKNVPFSKTFADHLMDQLIKNQPEQDAIGLMFYDAKEGSMIPLVYVKEVGSIVYESSCGSGTTAIAVAISHDKKENVDKLLLKQPGGTLEISYGMFDGEEKAILGGVVRKVCEGTYHIEER